MGKKIKPKLGDVFEFRLPNGKYAYGRKYEDIAYGFYKKLSDIPNNPPIGERDFFFISGFQDGVIIDGLYPIVGNDPFDNEEEAWPSPTFSYNDLFKKYYIYYKGISSVATEEECKGLGKLGGAEYIENIIKRIMKEIGEPLPEEPFISKDMIKQEYKDSIFNDDIAMDIKILFEELLDVDFSVKRATQSILNRYKEELNDSDDAPIIYLALAKLQTERNKLQKEIKIKALEILNNEYGLERWKEIGGQELEKRKKMLEELKQEILQS